MQMTLLMAVFVILAYVMIITECTTGDRTVGLGAGAGQFSLTAAEFTQITSSGMSNGGSMCGSQTIDGVANANSAGIGGVVTLNAVRDNAGVTFETTPSTFFALVAQADNGMVVNTDIVATAKCAARCALFSSAT